MKSAIGLFGLGLILFVGGCATEPGSSGYGGSMEGEYNETDPFGYSRPLRDGSYLYAPYDRDHYLDRDLYWERHRYPYNGMHWR